MYNMTKVLYIITCILRIIISAWTPKHYAPAKTFGSVQLIYDI